MEDKKKNKKSKKKESKTRNDMACVDTCDPCVNYCVDECGCVNYYVDPCMCC